MKLVNVMKIRQLAKEKGITITHLCSACGQQRGWLKDIANKNLDICEDKLQIIAEALETTTDYLRDLTDKKEKPVKKQELSTNIKILIELYDRLSPENQSAALQFLSFLEEKELFEENK